MTFLERRQANPAWLMLRTGHAISLPLTARLGAILALEQLSGAEAMSAVGSERTV